MVRRNGRAGRFPLRALLGLGLALALGAAERRLEAQAPPAPVWTADALTKLGPAELQALYRGAAIGPTPRGKVRGTALVAPGSPFGPAASRVARLWWQGKVFRDDGATAVNRFAGLRVVEGRLYQGASWLDGRPSLILDYQGTSRVYGDYRDEIRQVGPDLYLGLMYDRTTTPAPKLKMYFAFEARP